MPDLSIRLFGRLTIECNGQTLPNLEHKLQELLAYLLLYRNRIHSRETLAGLFWGETTTGQSKKNLRQALWQIHTALVQNKGRESLPINPDGTPLIIADSEWVQVDEKACFWMDTIELEEANEQTRNAPRGHFSAEAFERLKNAANLYRGDLLEGCYQDWCLFERERLQNLYLTCLGKLMDYCALTGEYEAGLHFGESILRIDYANEPTHRQLMRFYYFLGQRTAALRQFQHCRAALKKELDIEPEQRTLTLYQFLQTGQGEPAFEPDLPTVRDASPLPAGKTSQDPSGNMVEKLGRMRESLSAIQKQAQEGINQIDQVIKKIK